MQNIKTVRPAEQVKKKNQESNTLQIKKIARRLLFFGKNICHSLVSWDKQYLPGHF